MSLRTKTLLIVVLVLSVLITGLYAAISLTVRKSFDLIEEMSAGTDVERVMGAIHGQIDELVSSSRDYSDWDQTYAFMKDKNPAYARDISFTTLDGLKLNLMMFVDTSGNVVLARWYPNMGQDRAVSLPTELVDSLAPGGFLHEKAGQIVGGVFSVEGMPLLMSARPILMNEGVGPSRGTFVIGRILDAGLISRLSNMVKVDFTVFPFSARMRVGVTDLAITDEKPIDVRAVSKELIYGYSVLPDMLGKPAFMVRANVPRTIAGAVSRSDHYRLLSFLLIGLGMIVTTMFLLERIVLSRLLRASADITEIGKKMDFGRRLVPGGNDEISRLIEDINLMLDALDNSRNRLLAEQQSLQYTNEELMRLDSVRNTFSSMISHELRTPLGTIKEGVGLLADGVEGPVTKTQRDILNIIKRNLDRLIRMTVTILEYTKLESGHMQVRPEETDMARLMTDAVVMNLPAAKKAGIDLVSEIPTGEITTICDPDLINQVVTNLIRNAVKFTPTGGKVTVRLMDEGPKVRIEVEDTGIGILEKDWECIFDPFVRTHPTTPGMEVGAGLGLAICKAIVRLHGGDIGVKSEVDKGSIFTVVIPKSVI